MKKILLLIICFSSVQVFSQTAHHIHPTSGKTYVRSNNLSGEIFSPGDTMFIDHNKIFSLIELHGFHGSPPHPIIIINYKGQSVIGDPGGDINDPNKGVRLYDCSYIKITGSGSNDRYGLKIQNYPANMQHLGQWGIAVRGRSHNLEFDSLYITNVTMGIQIQQDPECDPLQNAPNNIFDSISIHHCKITKTWNQGMYLGTTNPDNAPPPSQGFYPRAVGCKVLFSGAVNFDVSASSLILTGDHTKEFIPGNFFAIQNSAFNNSNNNKIVSANFLRGKTTVVFKNFDGGIHNETASSVTLLHVNYYEPPRGGHFLIHDNIVDTTGRPGIQLSSASKGKSLIYNNQVHHNGMNGDFGQGTCIAAGLYSNVDIYNNTVGSSLQWNILAFFSGGRDTVQLIKNNQTDSAGYLRPFALHGQTTYLYDTIKTVANFDTTSTAIFIITAKQEKTDSTRFWLVHNKIGLSKSRAYGFGHDHADIRIADYNNTIVKNAKLNIVCSNTTFNGRTGEPKIVNETTPIFYTVYRRCPLSFSKTHKATHE